MENISHQKEYVSTKKAADILCLSVGTVQKLADKKILEAYITNGKHRRISVESIKIYSGKIGIKNLDTHKNISRSNHTCLILNTNNPTWDNFPTEKSESLTIIKSPFDFLTANSCIDNILIDARTSWIDFNKLTEESLISKAKFKMIFNIEILDEKTQKNLSEKFQMNTQSIDENTLQGLIIGLSLATKF